MKRLSSKELVPGMIAAEDVYNYTNQLIIPKGTVLNDKTITKLEFYSILNVRVEDPAPELVSTPDFTEDISYSEKIKRSKDFLEFKDKFDSQIPKFQSFLDASAIKDGPIDCEGLLSFTDNLLHNESGFLSVFDMLHNMREYDDMVYVHSINVALMCNVFAKWLHMTEEETKLATLCGLLHDIGKTVVPKDILHKNGRLSGSEYSVVKKHTIDGYNLLRRQNIPEAVVNAALMHHERCDGSGYPFGIKNGKIDTFAKMVAIVDVYDAMTSARIYRGPMCPFKVVDIFESEGLQKYDTRFIMTFLENIVNTYMLNRVKLNDGRVGDVVFINRSRLSKPTIRCEGEFLDLSSRPDLTIEAII